MADLLDRNLHENRFIKDLGDFSSLLKHYLKGYAPGFILEDKTGSYHKKYSGYDPEKYYEEPSDSENQLESVFKNAKSILDLGSGQGDSVKSVLKFTPNVTSVDTVDSGVAFVEISAQQHSHFKSDISAFLQDSSIPKTGYDIVIMRGVPTHHLDAANYESLFQNIAAKGIVLEFGDTLLNANEMIRVGFRELMSVETVAPRGDRLYDRIWQKPESDFKT